MDELLKDADVIHHTMNDSSKAIKEKEQARYNSIINELSLNMLTHILLNLTRWLVNIPRESLAILTLCRMMMRYYIRMNIR